MSSDAPTDPEPVNERNWHEKMQTAQMAYPGGRWRKQFTPQELEIIDRELDAEILRAMKALAEDRPGPLRIAFMD